MKKTIFLIFILISLLAGFFIVFNFSEKKEKGENEEALFGREVRLTEERTGIEVYNKEDEMISRLDFSRFQEWANENWEEVFEETPMFAEDIEETKVTPDSFYFFDEAVALSPKEEKVAFSVHSYFTATHLSFIGIFDIDADKLYMIRKENRGEVDDIFWSPDGKSITYTLSTARAKGDYLSIDNVESLQKEFTLSGEDIERKLDYKEALMPRFRDIAWKKEGGVVEFITDIKDLKKEAVWEVGKKGDSLELKEIVYKE